MDPNRFDSLSRFFADRRLSRREAVLKGGTAVAATGLAATGLTRAANAQDATPAATDEGGGSLPAFLFVQSFQGGSIAAKEGAEGRYTLNLESGAGQTIFFSDRPDRIVGAGPTNEVLDWLGFPDDNPPNAALVVTNTGGDTDVAVIELFDPVYDEATHSLTYEIEVLSNWEEALDLSFGEAPSDLATVEPTFGAAHLFIDSEIDTEGIFDCPDHDLVCYTGGGNPYNSSVGTIANADHDGFCVSRPSLLCYPCKAPDAGGSWADECNRRYADCNGGCNYYPSCTSTAPNWMTHCTDFG
jgi:hypothetical protein